MTDRTETLSPVKSLELVADEYINYAVKMGKVTISHISIRNGNVNGYTTAETESGVKITKHSSGLLTVVSAFEEVSGTGVTQDLEREIVIPADGPVEVTDTRTRTEDGEWTGEGGSRTLPKREHELAITEMVKLINTVY